MSMYFCRNSQFRLSVDFVDPDGIERDAQQVGQLQRHMLRRRTVIARQRGDGVQGVEQKVRLELIFSTSS